MIQGRPGRSGVFPLFLPRAAQLLPQAGRAVRPVVRSLRAQYDISTMMPTFFVAGVPKAGTSSMYSYLRQHPDIFMSGMKEPHFFTWMDDGWPRWAIRKPEDYKALFADARPHQERGEASTWTLYSEGAPRRIAEAVPDAKFIILLRNPVRRAYSNWSFNFGKGFEPIGSFEEALAAEQARIANGSPWHHHYLSAGMYYEQIERFLEVFDRRRLLVLLFEDMKRDARAVTRRAYEFLGVDPSFEADTRTAHNRTYFPRSRRLQRFSWQGGPAKSILKKLLPARTTARLGRKLKALNRTPPPPMSERVRRELRVTFREDVSRLSDLLDRDLHAVWFEGPSA